MRAAPLREHAGLRDADGRDVADRVDVREARRERPRVDRDVAVLGHPALEHDAGGAVLRHAEEEVVGHLLAVLEHGDAATGVERGDAPAGDELDAALGERLEQRRRGVGRRRHGRAERHDERDLAVVADAALGQVVVQEEGRLARRRRALERRAAHADDRAAAGERRQHLSHTLGAGDRVELVSTSASPGVASKS